MFNSPNAQDVFSNNRENLFGQFGMDWKGDNESGAWARRNQQVIGSGLTNANAYAANTLEPARQNNLNNVIGMLSPGNVQAKTQRVAQGMVNQGASIGEQQAKAAQARGYSPEYAQAVRALLASRGQRAANEHIAGEDERLMQNAMIGADIISKSQQNPFLQQFMALAQLIEGRSAQNKADKEKGGLGGILGTLGSLAGMAGGMDFGSLFGSSAPRQTIVPNDFTMANAPGTYTYGIGR
jgi:hypothetical protein